MTVSACRWRHFLSAAGLAILLLVTPAGALADTPTETPTPTAETVSEPSVPPTSTSTPAPTWTPRPTATAVPRPTMARERKAKRHRKRRKHPSPYAGVSPTPTVTVKSGRPTRHHRARKHAAPSPSPTATPAYALNTEDSISPVTCNGTGKPTASHAFLDPPYHGWISLVSYFDHDSPNFDHDGLTIIANGTTARVDPDHQRHDFPAYWNNGLRQYIYYDGHNGYDYNLWYQPVYAAASGKVIYADLEYSYAPDHGYGNMIMLAHGHGYVTLYGHLSKFLIKKGQKVHRGQEIGVSGNTGHSTGPHLHFTVFHNCTPVDPYGWTGGGTDPLESYQNESSVPLWRQWPLIVNPPPDWPGTGTEPAPSSRRIALLRLPPPVGGTAAFTRALRAEADRVVRAAKAIGAEAQVDMIDGAVSITGPVSALQIYRMRDVASITSPDTIEGAREDVLSAVTKAALSGKTRPIVLSKKRDWVGYLLHWGGRTLLVGRGKKGAHVVIRVSSGRGGQVVAADPVTGAYVLDFGRLTPGEDARLSKELRQRAGTGRAVAPAPRGNRDSPAKSTRGFTWLPLLPIALVLAVAVGAGMRRRTILSKIRPR